MHIYLFTDPLISQSHTFIYDEIAQLEALNNRIRIVSLFKYAPQDAGRRGRRLPAKIMTRDINYFSCYDISRKASFSSPGEAYNSIKYLVNNLIDNGFRRFGMDTLRGLIAKERPDLFLVHYGALGEKFLYLKKEFNIPYIVYFHGTEYDRTQRERYNDFKGLFRYADRFLVKSRHSFEEIVKLGCDPGKVTVIPFGIDPDNYDIGHEKKALTSSRIRILGVGNLVEFKDFRLALDVINNCRRSYSDIRYDIIGGGPLFEELSGKIKLSGLADICFLHGAKDNKTVSEYMRNADIYLQPVRYANGRTETFGNSLIEAQLHGLPVVSTDIGGVPETVIHGKTGFLAPENDADALTGYMSKLIDNEILRKEMGERGKRNVLDNFNSKKNAVELDRILSRSLRERSGELKHS